MKKQVMAKRYPLLLAISLCFAVPLYADEANPEGEVNPGGLEPVPAPPTLPDPVVSGEAIEPEVTIVRKDDATIEEYRINGRLYMIKVIPLVGKPYYLVDKNGDGRMDSRMNDLTNGFVVPQWVIYSW